MDWSKVANHGMQIMGGHGYTMECDMPRHFRSARLATIGAGTSQIQGDLIARTMGLGAGRAADAPAAPHRQTPMEG